MLKRLALMMRRRPTPVENEQLQIDTAAPAAPPAKPEPVVHEATGKVIRRSEALEGIFRHGSTTYFHLAVEVADEQGNSIVTVSDTHRFLMLPLAQIGDRVVFSYTLPADGHPRLQTFGIEWPTDVKE